MPHHDSKHESCKDGKPFEHKIQLYLADAYGVQVPNTEFWVTLTIIKEGCKVTIKVPAINFQTGPYANNIYETNNPITGASYLPPPQSGGYLNTLSGFLPKKLRPNELINLSYFAGSNNGNNITFSYGAPPFTSPSYTPPLPGFLLQLTNAGALVIQGLGTLSNIIPPGNQNVLPTSFTYIIEPKIKLGENTQINFGAINTAVFPYGSYGSNNAVRDSHVNDAFDGVVAYAWSDNSDVPDKNPNIMHLAVDIGKVKNGKLKMRKPMFIPIGVNNGVGFVWDTAMAINRTDKKNIVVSYGVLLFPPVQPPGSASSFTCYATSFDGGKTWPINGLTQTQPSGFQPGTTIPGGFGDNPGVRADKFGNFWYMSIISWIILVTSTTSHSS